MNEGGIDVDAARIEKGVSGRVADYQMNYCIVMLCKYVFRSGMYINTIELLIYSLLIQSTTPHLQRWGICMEEKSSFQKLMLTPPYTINIKPMKLPHGLFFQLFPFGELSPLPQPSWS